jgi:hypothetical protein
MPKNILGKHSAGKFEEKLWMLDGSINSSTIGKPGMLHYPQ